MQQDLARRRRSTSHRPPPRFAAAWVDTSACWAPSPMTLPRLVHRRRGWRSGTIKFVRLTRSLAAIYGGLRARAHGSVAQARAAVDPGMDRITQVGPRWAKAGDALLNAL
jgi:hypothetical protein